MESSLISDYIRGKYVGLSALLIREIYSQENIRNEKTFDRSRSIFSIPGRELENILFPRMDTRRVIIKRAAVSIYPTCARLFL